MADFLSRLAERSLGTAAVIRPVPVPLFAPAPARDALRNPGEGPPRLASEDHGDALPPELVFPQPLVTRKDPLANVAWPLGRSLANSRNGSQIQETPDTLSNDETTVVRTLADGNAPLIAKPRPRTSTNLPPRSGASSVQPYPAGDEGSALPLPSLVARASRPSSPQSSVETLRHGSPSVAMSLVLPHERGRPGLPEQGQEAGEPTHRTTASPPVIRVTIGRIDVRAIVPPSPAVSRAPSGRSAPRLSLQEYLGQHERRKR